MYAGKSEYVQGLTLEECATLLNIDVANKELMEMVYDTAFAIKNRIYGNRIVLFAPLYIANYCVNNCTYCAFRAGNKNLQVCWVWGFLGGTGGAGFWPVNNCTYCAFRAGNKNLQVGVSGMRRGYVEGEGVVWRGRAGCVRVNGVAFASGARTRGAGASQLACAHAPPHGPSHL